MGRATWRWLTVDELDTERDIPFDSFERARPTSPFIDLSSWGPFGSTAAATIATTFHLFFFSSFTILPTAILILDGRGRLLFLLSIPLPSFGNRAPLYDRQFACFWSSLRCRRCVPRSRRGDRFALSVEV